MNGKRRICRIVLSAAIDPFIMGHKTKRAKCVMLILGEMLLISVS